MKILSMKTTIFLGVMLSLLVCLMFAGCSILKQILKQILLQEDHRF